MKERIANLVGDDAKDIWMGTFHSICVRILRRFIDRIGFDSSTGIYAINQGTGIHFWNIRPYSFKKASVYFSSGSASVSATGVTTSSTILATRGDSNLSGGNYGGIGAADCISNGTISLGATNLASATWTVNLFWCK